MGHPHPAGQEVVHQALLLLAEFGEVGGFFGDKVVDGIHSFCDGNLFSFRRLRHVHPREVALGDLRLRRP